jgi:hypothetical protein
MPPTIPSTGATRPIRRWMTRLAWIKKLAWVLGVILIVGLLFPTVGLPHGSKRAAARTDLAGLLATLKQYQVEYATLPIGNAAEIMNALRGENSRKIIFFDGKPTAFNAQGAFLDPWGTPYRIDLSKPEAPRVWSCGPNRRDEGGAKDSDDIVSWR